MSFLQNEEQAPRRQFRFLDTASRVVLAVLTFALPLFVLPYTRDIFDLPKQLLLSGMVLLCFLFWLLRGALIREITIRRTMLDLPIGVFAAAAIVSAFFSVSPVLSWLGRPGDYVFAATSILSFALLFWLLIQYVRGVDAWRMLTQIFLLSGIGVGGLFLFRSVSFLAPLSAWYGFNTVGPINSSFGIFMAIVGIVAMGFLMERYRPIPAMILPALAAIASVAVLCRLGFAISWIIFAVGVALLLMIGSVMYRDTRPTVISLSFFLFLITMFFIFTETPALLKEHLPSELALGAETSWRVGEDALASGVKPFLVGFGPGAFSHVYSQFRPIELNAVAVAWSTRFHHPFNVPFALLAETGIVGALAFFFLMLFHAGGIAHSWLRNRHEMQSQLHYPDDDSRLLAGEKRLRPMEVYVIGIAWITATVALFVAFYGVSMWFVWWWLLAMSVIGLLPYARGTIKEMVVLLDVSPQYSLALSFSLILLFTAALFFGIFAGKLYRAEIAFTRAVHASRIEDQEQALNEALDYRPRYAEYRLALAGVYFQEARNDSDRGASADTIASRLASAVNAARMAADTDAHSVETWETLSLTYLNARQFAPEASQWAKDALGKAIELEPTNPVFHVQMGALQESANQADEAEKSYRHAIELKYDYLPAYTQLSGMYERKNKLTEAINVYQPIATLLDQNPELLFNIGRLFYNRNGSGDVDRAEIAFQRALQLSPRYSNALYSLGVLYEKKGDRAKALEQYKKVKELNPDNADIAKKVNDLLR